MPVTCAVTCAASQGGPGCVIRLRSGDVGSAERRPAIQRYLSPRSRWPARRLHGQWTAQCSFGVRALLGVRHPNPETQDPILVRKIPACIVHACCWVFENIHARMRRCFPGANCLNVVQCTHHTFSALSTDASGVPLKCSDSAMQKHPAQVAAVNRIKCLIPLTASKDSISTVGWALTVLRMQSEVSVTWNCMMNVHNHAFQLLQDTYQ